MAGTPPDDPNHLSSGTASITVLAVKPVKFGRIFALASVEIDLDRVSLVIHGVRAASAWSVRPTPDARVSMPLEWDEVADCDPAAFTLGTAPARAEQLDQGDGPPE